MLSAAAGDFANDLHPNNQGYNKMAGVWRNAMAYAQEESGLITPPVAGTTSPGKVACDKNSMWILNHQVATGGGLGNAQFPDLQCSSNSNNPSICGCGSVPAGPDSMSTIEYSTPLVGSSCEDMGYPNIRAITFADLDGDGRAEYLRLGSHGEVHAFYNQGSPDGQESPTSAQVSWQDAGQIASGVGARPEEVRFADLNGDGRAEYTWVHPNGSASVWLNQGQTGTTPANIGWPAQGLVATGIGFPGAAVQFADLNGDGKAEYIALNDNGGAVVYLNLGPKQGSDPHSAQVAWLSQTQTTTGVGGHRNQTVFADTNGDRRADYLFFPHGNTRTGTGDVEMWLNGGGPDNGSHAAEIVWHPQGQIATGNGTPAVNVAFADLNGDGRAEYLEIDPTTGAVTAYLNGCPDR